MRRARRNAGWLVLLVVLVAQAFPAPCPAALPQRLVLLVDGVAYRDVQALQEGVTYKDIHGRQFHRQGFQEGYFPVSRMISTFPSISDPSWSEILGNRAPPGYQRTFFDAHDDSEISLNGVTSSEEYENQMTWQMEGGFHRTLSYISPRWAFQYEVNSVIEGFLHADGQTNYYALIHSTDSAQHLSGDIFAMMCTLDEKLRQLREIYRAREGRELEILLLSDHGNNHAGPGQRVAIRGFLKNFGYRVAKSIKDPNDVVLPTAGIESWVEIHNAPAKTETLAELLTHLEGADVVTARLPGQANRFLILNSKGERAILQWNPARNSFRYSPEKGDPIGYRPVAEALAKRNALDSGGFATAEAWMAETFTNHYPDALERIVRGHTQVAGNPATILVSLKNGYIHSDWFIKQGSLLTKCGGTHGALDDINSDGILLSNFVATKDTTTSRVAALFDGFQGRRDGRGENGAEWIVAKAGTTHSFPTGPLEMTGRQPSPEEVFLRIWTPVFAGANPEAPVDILVRKAGSPRIARSPKMNPAPGNNFERHLKIERPLASADCGPHERVYAFPAELNLRPQTAYQISGRIADRKKSVPIFTFTFHTDNRGRPMVTETDAKIFSKTGEPSASAATPTHVLPPPKRSGSDKPMTFPKAQS